MSQKPMGIVLAGGQSRRMGGIHTGGDKGLIELGGQTLISRVIERLSPQVQSLAISANGDPLRFSGFGLEVIEDSVKGHVGPLAGILSGLDWAAKAGTTHVVSAAVDTPFFPENLVEKLKESADKNQKPIVLAASIDPDTGLRCHPTFGLWPVALREELRLALSGRARKVLRWAQDQGSSCAAFEFIEYDPFFNVNTVDDLAKAEVIIRAETR